MECESFELRHLNKCSDNYSVKSRHATLMINGFNQISCEKRQLTWLNYCLSGQQFFSRSQKQMSAICSPPFIVAFLNQSTFTIRSVLYFHNHVMYLYRLQCKVILGWSSSSSLITMTTIMDSWIVIDSLAAWPLSRSTDEYKLKERKKHVLDDPSLEANQCSDQWSTKFWFKP